MMAVPCAMNVAKLLKSWPFGCGRFDAITITRFFISYSTEYLGRDSRQVDGSEGRVSQVLRGGRAILDHDIEVAIGIDECSNNRQITRRRGCAEARNASSALFCLLRSDDTKVEGLNRIRVDGVRARNQSMPHDRYPRGNHHGWYGVWEGDTGCHH